MFYIYFIIITTLIILISPIYNSWVRKQNENIMLDNREFDESTPYKNFLPKITSNVAYIYIVGLFVIFIISRISLCGLSEQEYKSQYVIIPNEELTIDVDNHNYLMYVDKELVGFNMDYMKVVVDENIDKPIIKNYYTRTIKQPSKHPERYFLYNRKEVKIGDWNKTYESCGCGGGELTLLLPKEYKINTK